MKVLMFGWEFPPHISGGLGTACYGLTKGLSSFSDIDLTFVIPKVYGNEANADMKLMGASDVELSEATIKKQHEFEMNRFNDFCQQISAYITPEQFEQFLKDKKERLSSSVLNASAGKLAFSGKYGAGLIQEISRYGVVASQIAKNEPHDIIHAHDWLTYPAGIEAKSSSGKPLIVHVHATEFDRCGENYNKEVYNIEKKGMEAADKVITVSDLTRNIVIKKYNILPSKVITVYNGVEKSENHNIKQLIKKGNNEKIVTFLGRITRQKGPEYFVEAAYKVLQKMDNVRFVMAGNGDLMEKMIVMVSRLKISDHFHFTGFLKGDDVNKMYSMSDLYVMPSVSEPFGISPLEAIQSNVPVIISKQSGVSEVIENAIKIDYWDTEAMADAIYGILNYRPLADILKKKGKLEVDKLSWANVAEKVKEIYYQVA